MPHPSRPAGAGAAAAPAAAPDDAATQAFLDDLEARTFHYFWDLAEPGNGLVPDRAPTPSFSSIAAVGFALTAYPVGVERGWITRAQARRRVLSTLRFLAAAAQGPGPAVTGYHGFFYHFLDMSSGRRFAHVELSTIDTTLLMAGVLFCQSYFDHGGADGGGYAGNAGKPENSGNPVNPGPAGDAGDAGGGGYAGEDDKAGDDDEAAIRAAADALYRRVDWNWAQPNPPGVSMGWTPEGGFLPYEWRGYNEAMVLYVLALGSPTHPVDSEAWTEYTRSYLWGEHYGETYVAFGPLFGYQFSHVWIDFRGIRDAFMRAHGSDYFESSRRATYAHRAYAAANPDGWRGYGADVWGLTACDGPDDTTLEVDGRSRTFHSYWPRGTSLKETRDDGTIAPAAAAGSIAFAPEIALPALAAMRRLYGGRLYSTYGFLDAFNPTFRPAAGARPHHGQVVPGVGWFDIDYLGIDQGPIVAMIENHRSGLIWRTLRKNPYIVRGLRRAGFTGGWLDAGGASAGGSGAPGPPR